MKRALLLISCLGFGSLAAAQTNGADTTVKKSMVEASASFKVFDKYGLKLDLKFIDPEKGSFGIDYQFQLDKKLLGKDPAKINKLNLSLGSSGFVTVAEDKNKNSSLISEIKLEGQPLFHVKGKDLGPSSPIDPLADDDPELPPGKDPLVQQIRDQAAQVASPLWLSFNLHAKHETTQDFRNYDFAFGPQLAVSTSYLSSILDFPFGLLRAAKNNNPRQLDLSVGYDYVTGANKTSLAPLLEDSKFMNRLNLKAEWETGILSGNERIAFLFDSYYDLDRNLLLKNAGKDWNYFYMIRIEKLLKINLGPGTKTKIAIKYTAGELPPNFDKGFVLGGGFSIDF
ncbi:hypothetical protein [Pedobacter borealis]|uniref:hypothetical protein n=1 Tax=Pedobacter borealis TaxID=475254 RepID=UPI0004936D85|nr:hypothetical protein [Pedobacter borealis]